MKQGVYIIYNDLSISTGVNKKIRGQIKAFEMAGFQMETVLMEAKNISGYKILFRLPFTNVAPEWKWNEKFKNCDFIYLRRPFFMNGFFIDFLKEIKHKNPRVKIILEIPTYPYDKEITQKKSNITVYIKERLARKKLKKCVDRISLLFDYKYVFGVQAIRIKNGFDFSTTEIRAYNKEKASIDIAVVSIFESWHGYERLLFGLHDYYKEGEKEKVILHFVGDGTELDNYKKIVNTLELSDSVKFYGLKDAEFIKQIYNNCDFGACSMGIYKKGAELSSELKSREYLAAGLPIIIGCRLDVADNKRLEPFILEYPNDDSKIDVERIVDFYNDLYRNKDEDEIKAMSTIIRSEAIKELDLKESVKNVIKFIKEEM